MKFVTIFLHSYNQHLSKDVGALPYYFHKIYPCDSYLVTYKNDDYSNLKIITPGLKLFFIRRSLFGEIFDILFFLLFQGKTIDVLNLYHLGIKSLIFSLFYKLINRKGIILLKSDAGIGTFRVLKGNIIRRFFAKCLLKLSCIVVVESRYMCRLLSKIYHRHYTYLPNGFFDDSSIPLNIKKEQTVLFVGRIDSPEKNVDLLVQAFARSYIWHEWQLTLVGPCCSSFYEKLKDICCKENQLAWDKIQFTGEIQDRYRLNEIYAKSSIFVLPSKFESFGIVLVEALRFGNYLIGSNHIPALVDITDCYKYGVKTNTNIIDDFSGALINSVNKIKQDNSLYEEEIEFANDNFAWSKIIKKMILELDYFSSKS